MLGRLHSISGQILYIDPPHTNFRLISIGIECKTYGLGSTPVCSQPSEPMRKVTEWHPGCYIFYGRYSFGTNPNSFFLEPFKMTNTVYGKVVR